MRCYGINSPYHFINSMAQLLVKKPGANGPTMDLDVGRRGFNHHVGWLPYPQTHAATDGMQSSLRPAARAPAFAAALAFLAVIAASIARTVPVSVNRFKTMSLLTWVGSSPWGTQNTFKNDQVPFEHHPTHTQ